MKLKLIATLLLLSITATLSASDITERVYRNFKHAQLSFGVCYNYSDVNDKTTFKYKALSALLNTYIVERSKELRTANISFRVEVGCVVFGEPPFFIEKNEKGFYIFIHGMPDLELLTRVVEYCFSPQWEETQIDTNFNYQEYEPMRKDFLNKLDNIVPSVNLNNLRQQQIEVFQLGDLTIKYNDEKLILSIGGNKTPSFSHPCPVQLKDRYFVVNDSILTVYNSQAKPIITQRLHIEKGYTLEYYQLSVVDDEIQWSIFGNLILRYNYKENQFYKTADK